MRLSFDIIRLCQNMQEWSKNDIQLRIGIDIGNVIVGITGVYKPSLTLIGNAVYQSKKISKSSRFSGVSISENVYEIIQNTKIHETYNIEYN